MSQKMELFIATAVKTADPAFFLKFFLILCSNPDIVYRI
jgi:hypothetical protein